MEIPEPDRTGPDRSIHMKMGQNMTKFDENGSKYDEIWWKSMILGWKIWFWSEKKIFVVKKHVFMMIWGTQKEKLKKCLNKIETYFFQNFIFDQEFDSNGPGA